MPLPSLRKQVVAAPAAKAQLDDALPGHSAPPKAAPSEPHSDRQPPTTAAAQDMGSRRVLPAIDAASGAAADAHATSATPPTTNATCEKEAEDTYEPPNSGAAWVWAGLIRLTQLPMVLQVALISAPIVALSWPWIFQPAPRRAAHPQLSGDVGADGYPRIALAQADRKVTEQDTALMLQHVGEHPRAQAPMPHRRGQKPSHDAKENAAGSHATPLNWEAATEKRRRSIRRYGAGGTLGGPQENASDAAALPVGTRIEVVLDVGTSTAHRGAVMGRVVKDVVSPQGQVLLGVGAYLKGRASGDFDASRMFVDFDQAVASGKTLRLQGYAIAHNEPGIAASKRENTPQDRQKASFADGVLETAKDVAGRVGEGVASTLTRNVAHRSVSQIQKDIAPQPSYVLSLPAGAHFEVLVTG